MAVPLGFELVEEDEETKPLTSALQLPAGFEVVSPAEDLTKPDFVGASIVEPAKAVGGAIVGEISSGILELSKAIGLGVDKDTLLVGPLFDETAKRAREIVESTPQTKAGQDSLKTLGEGVKFLVDKFNFAASGIGGLIELVSGQGVEQAEQTINQIQEQGLGEPLAQRFLEENTDLSPEGAATVAAMIKTAPTAIGLAVGGEALPLTRQLFKTQTPGKRRIAELIERGSTDVETARFKIATPRDPTPPKVQSKLEGFIDVGGPKVATDRTAVNAIDRGFDEGVIAAIKGASPGNKAKMLEMVNIMERGKKNKRFAVTNRPGDVAGNSLMERFKVILKAKNNAGQQLDGVANGLRGKQIDVSEPVSQFIADLESIGVTLGRNLKPRFRGSDIEGSKAAQKIIRDTVERMKLTKTPDARDVHRLKKFIDERVIFGKSKEGLGGKTERIVKTLRRNMDQLLDSNFPEYDRVNTVFAETANAIDALQDVAGRKFNLTGKNADKAVGTLLRRLMSNAQSRVILLDAIDEVERVALKHAPTGALTDDLLTQALFVDELDSVFGAVARTSFQGQISQAVERGISEGGRGIIRRGVGKGAEKIKVGVLGTDEERAFAAIKRLLSE